MDTNKKKRERLKRLKQPKNTARKSVFREYETPKNHAKTSPMRVIDLKARFDAVFTAICITAIIMLSLILSVQVQNAKSDDAGMTTTMEVTTVTEE